MASNTTIKEVKRSGISINKEKLMELIKKSSQQTFIYSQNLNSKEAIVIIPMS